MTEALLLVLAGVAAGLCGSIAGLASLASYPALLAAGLPPLAANVTNTTALLANGVGTALGSRRELAGQGRRVAVLCAWAALGGTLGAGLLLLGGEETFEVVVPGLVALGAVLLLARDRMRAWVARRGRGPLDTGAVPGAQVAAVGVYGGYFGAAAGIIMLAVLSVRTTEPLAVTNAVKNLATSAANAVAAVVYAVLAPVDWSAAGCVAAGALVGGWVGPQVVRVLPETPLRWAIGVAGLGLAVHLGLAAA
ncbi:sulfite exporter TauE/SafE family protein [Nocardioides zeae]|uniref:Probable membrane transporter protein n=1 Tax=Nocardioides zeae TaxID=1457234 RepID=A0AAJ1U3H6_9ACTN|nr:sulfite exporter TauE/SafE family protein [Nocardioides zeae]MDQ1105240.1 putative membrane protein YfcA [Nocardioides zeae]